MNLKKKEKNISTFKKNKGFCLYRTDICDTEVMEKIFKKEKPVKICHLAASVGVRNSIINPKPYLHTNIDGTQILLELAVKYGINNFVFASSSSVYGNNKKIPFSEDDQIANPLSPYAATKAVGELLLSTYHNLYGLNCTALRFFTVYGSSGRPDMAPFLFTDAIFKGKLIQKYGKGNSKRDYTYIDDVIDGVINALEKNLSFEIINLGNNKPIELNKFISLIEKILKKKAVIKQCPVQPGDANITYADISKAKKLIEYNPKTSIEDGMNKFINWYLKNN